MITRIARPYARAFLDSVQGEDATAALRDLHQLREALERVPRLAAFALHPGIPLTVKERTFEEVLSSLDAGQPTRRLVLLLVRNFRVGHLPAILEAFEDLLDRRRGVSRATVTCAQPLEGAQREQVERTVRELIGHDVRLELAVDDELLGGFVVQVGSVRYDASLDGQLRRLREQLGAAA
ncbi:MAG TPA: ATP synthase F1 subunit delta [Thermoanaerobaculia bacterium]|nr:ATP synthase F1 subunit delta [Thermoanaerobaculia bacterium]